jgi:hypothetical protein
MTYGCLEEALRHFLMITIGLLGESVSTYNYKTETNISYAKISKSAYDYIDKKEK